MQVDCQVASVASGQITRLTLSSIPRKVHHNGDSNPVLMRKEYSNALLKVVGFLRVLRFHPKEKVDRVAPLICIKTG